MTTKDEMPDEIWAWVPEILYGEYTASALEHKKPAVEYIRADAVQAKLDDQERQSKSALAHERSLTNFWSKRVDEEIKNGNQLAKALEGLIKDLDERAEDGVVAVGSSVYFNAKQALAEYNKGETK